MPVFTRPEEVLDYIHDGLESNKEELGIKYVGYGDENLIPGFPAVLVTADPLSKEIHATQVFKNNFNLSLWVYHADFKSTRQVRNREDLLLVTAIKKFLHSDYTLGGQIIFGFVDGEFPGIMRDRKGSTTVGTRITWYGQGRERFSGEGV